MTEENKEPEKVSTQQTIQQFLKNNPGMKVRKGKNGGITITNPNAPSSLLSNLFKKAGIAPTPPAGTHVRNVEEEKT
jgi:hypothetical protein